MVSKFQRRMAWLAAVGCCMVLALSACSGDASGGGRGSSAKADLSGPPETQVLQAARAGDLKAVKALVAGNPDLVNALDPGSRMSVLHFAGESDNLDTIKFLLEKGANPLAMDDQGRTPAQCAEEARASQPVTTLLGKAAKTARDAAGVAQANP